MAALPTLEVGDKAPLFCLRDQNNQEICLNNYQGQWLVLYFYPKDHTPGCTAEACDFTGAVKKFVTLDTPILGVSPDSVASHKKFEQQFQLSLTLLSDPDHAVLEKYSVWKPKKNYGQEYYGVERTTFIISPDGVIAHIWPHVRVEGHIAEVLAKVRELQQA